MKIEPWVSLYKRILKDCTKPKRGDKSVKGNVISLNFGRV